MYCAFNISGLIIAKCSSVLTYEWACLLELNTLKGPIRNIAELDNHPSIFDQGEQQVTCCRESGSPMVIIFICLLISIKFLLKYALLIFRIYIYIMRLCLKCHRLVRTVQLADRGPAGSSGRPAGTIRSGRLVRSAPARRMSRIIVFVNTWVYFW